MYFFIKKWIYLQKITIGKHRKIRNNTHLKRVLVLTKLSNAEWFARLNMELLKRRIRIKSNKNGHPNQKGNRRIGEIIDWKRRKNRISWKRN